MEEGLKKIIVFVIIGFLIGFIVGETLTIRAVAYMASGFLDIELVHEALGKYSKNIKSCYPSLLENASIINDTGN